MRANVSALLFIGPSPACVVRTADLSRPRHQASLSDICRFGPAYRWTNASMVDETSSAAKSARR
jgi:hypothetical protein